MLASSGGWCLNFFRTVLWVMQLSLVLYSTCELLFHTDSNRLELTPSTIEIEILYPNFFIPASHPFFTVGSVPLAPSPGSKQGSPFIEKVWRDGKPLSDTGKKWIRRLFLHLELCGLGICYTKVPPLGWKLEIRFSLLFPEKRACLLCYFLRLGKILLSD